MKKRTARHTDQLGVQLPTLGLRFAFLVIGLTSLPAFATLGGNSATVLADQAAFGASLAKNTTAGYTDYTLTLPSGIIVHEFVNATDQVFEVTWNGKGTRPDMKQLLGPYFNQTITAPKKGHPTLRRADIAGSNVEIHSAVVNRVFSGTAHIPSKIPSTLNGPVNVPNDRITPTPSNNVNRNN